MNNKERALLIAEQAHANQTYDIYPYMYHIRMVMYILEDLGYDEDTVIAGILHDTYEDTTLTYNKVKLAFNERIAEIVYCVTDEMGINRKERKLKTYPKIRGNWRAVAVKIADRIANMTHSKQYTPDMFEMYQKEFNDFKEAINNPEHPSSELKKAWDRLELICSENCNG